MSQRAFNLADELLSDLPNRLAHVRGTSERAQAVPLRESELLSTAAVLHDIGYSEQITDTGFHPIDGARHLRRLHFDERVVNLVAHHSCARIEADLRGLRSILDDEFPVDSSLPHAELCFCDMTTSPNGKPITVDERIKDIRERYGPGSIVSNFVDQAEQDLRQAVADVQTKYDL